MPQLILILLALIIITLLLSHKTREVAVGICQTTLDQTVRKNTNKDKALEFIKSQGEAGNEERPRGSYPAPLEGEMWYNLKNK